MFCKNCGKELSANVRFCPNCGVNVDESNKNPESGRKGGQEIVLMEGLCNRVKSPLFVQNGSAILTNRRFIYLKHSLGKTMALGVLVNLTKGDYEFDIPLENILSISDGRQGVSKTIIINTYDGKKYNFYVSKREEWKIKLQSAITGVL